MAKNKLPEGYKGVDKLIEEFRKDNPKGKIETQPVLLGDGYVIITAKVTKDDGAIGSGMADADVQDDKSVEKAESGAIRRALLTLGYKSVEVEESDDKEEKEEKSEKRSFKREEKKEDADDNQDDEQDEEEEEEEEKPRSRFGNKNSDRSEKRKDDDQDEESDEEQEEGESRFKRGSRFQRN